MGIRGLPEGCWLCRTMKEFLEALDERRARVGETAIVKFWGMHTRPSQSGEASTK